MNELRHLLAMARDPLEFETFSSSITPCRNTIAGLFPPGTAIEKSSSFTENSATTEFHGDLVVTNAIRGNLTWSLSSGHGSVKN